MTDHAPSHIYRCIFPVVDKNKNFITTKGRKALFSHILRHTINTPFKSIRHDFGAFQRWIAVHLSQRDKLAVKLTNERFAGYH